MRSVGEGGMELVAMPFSASRHAQEFSLLNAAAAVVMMFPRRDRVING